MGNAGIREPRFTTINNSGSDIQFSRSGTRSHHSACFIFIQWRHVIPLVWIYCQTVKKMKKWERN